MKIKDFVQTFPNITIKEIADNSDTLRSGLLDMYNKVEMISLNYNLDDLHQDQIQSLVNEIKDLVFIIKR